MILSKSDVVGVGIQGQDGRGITSTGTLVVANSLVSNNRSYESGGGILSQGTLTVRNSVIKGNWSDRWAGGILVFGQTTITGTTITGNFAEEDAGGFDSDNQGCCVTITNSVISNNLAYHGQGGGVWNWGTMTIKGSRIFGNESGNPGEGTGGDGIYNHGPATLTLINTQVYSNSNEDGGNGSAIYNNGTLTLDRSRVFDNHALASGSYGFGGGIYNAGSATLKNGTEVTANVADADGGGVYNVGTISVGSDVLIHDNIPNDCVGC